MGWINNRSWYCSTDLVNFHVEELDEFNCYNYCRDFVLCSRNYVFVRMMDFVDCWSLGRAVVRGTVSKKLAKEICVDKGWVMIADDSGVIIYDGGLL